MFTIYKLAELFVVSTQKSHEPRVPHTLGTPSVRAREILTAAVDALDGNVFIFGIISRAPSERPRAKVRLKGANARTSY